MATNQLMLTAKWANPYGRVTSRIIHGVHEIRRDTTLCSVYCVGDRWERWPKRGGYVTCLRCLAVIERETRERANIEALQA